jgi:hypothetical protein
MGEPTQLSLGGGMPTILFIIVVILLLKRRGYGYSRRGRRAA